MVTCSKWNISIDFISLEVSLANITEDQSCWEEGTRGTKKWGGGKVFWWAHEASVMLHPAECLSNDFHFDIVVAAATRTAEKSERSKKHSIS